MLELNVPLANNAVSVQLVITAVILILIIIGLLIYIFQKKMVFSSLKCDDLKSPLKNINSNEDLGLIIDNDYYLVGVLTELLNIGFTGTSMVHIGTEIVEILRKYYRVDYITLYTLTETGWYRTLATNKPKDLLNDAEKYYNHEAGDMSGITRVRVIEGVLDSQSYLGKSQIHYSNFTKLIQDGRNIGGLVIEHRNREDIDGKGRQFQLYEKVYTATALVLNHLIEVSNLIATVSTDQLTGVYNRRFIDLTLAEEIEKHKNMGQTFNLVMLDIDYFKKFNDTYGHQFGDKVLQEVSQYIKYNLGKHSWVARYGGEEFMIFVANSDVTRVYKKIDNLRKGISNLVVEHSGKRASVTVSFGISGFPRDGVCLEELISRADEALYKSKAAGRNKVTVYGEPNIESDIDFVFN